MKSLHQPSSQSSANRNEDVLIGGKTQAGDYSENTGKNHKFCLHHKLPTAREWACFITGFQLGCKQGQASKKTTTTRNKKTAPSASTLTKRLYEPAFRYLIIPPENCISNCSLPYTLETTASRSIQSRGHLRGLKDCNLKSNLQIFNLLRNSGVLFHALIKFLYSRTPSRRSRTANSTPPQSPTARPYPARSV